MQDHQKESERGHQEIQPRDHATNDHGTKEPEESPKTQKLSQNRLNTLLDKQGREIHNQDKIIERIEEFYTGLYDSEHCIIIQIDPKKVQEITSWELEAALRYMNNGTATSNEYLNIDTLKAGGDSMSKTLAKLYTKCLSERRIATAWKDAKMMIFFKKGNQKNLKNYVPLCLQSKIYKVLTKGLTKRLEKHSTKTSHESKPDL